MKFDIIVSIKLGMSFLAFTLATIISLIVENGGFLDFDLNLV